MGEQNEHLITQMRWFIDSLKSMRKDSAIEIGCGDCHVTRELLQDRFSKIDLMD